MTAPSRSWRPTAVQRDVLDRLRAGWRIPRVLCAGDWLLCKPGQPSRHVADATVYSLLRRGLIKRDDSTPWNLVLAE